MKNITFLVILNFLVSAGGRAQPINYYLTTDSVVYCGTEYHTFWASAIIENNGLDSIIIEAKRLVNQVPNFPNWQSAMCADLCYPIPIDSIRFTIQPDTFQLFKMMFRYWVHNYDTAHTYIHFQSVTPGIMFEQYQNFYAMDSLVLFTSVNEIVTDKYLNIYPNPASSASGFTISCFNPVNNASIEIYDVFGKKFFTENITNVSQKEIQFENIEAGIYFVKVRESEKEYCIKLVIE